MIKHELIDILIKKKPNMEPKDVVLAVDCIIESIIKALIRNDRVEIRGFGSFSLHYHPPV
jgi:integration host factor subunit beta